MSLNFDLSTAKRNLEYYRSIKDGMVRRLDEGKRINKEREKLASRLSKARDLRDKLTIYQSALDSLHRKASVEDVEFKDRRLAYVSNKVSDNLDIIFPFEGYKVTIKSRVERRINKTKLTLTNSRGVVRVPHINEGKLLQGTISFSSSAAINDSFDSNKMYLDEAFAASDQDNLPKLAKILYEYIKNGLQVIMIEQSPEGYQTIPRREFSIHKNYDLDKTVVAGYKDY